MFGDRGNQIMESMNYCIDQFEKKVLDLIKRNDCRAEINEGNYQGLNRLIFISSQMFNCENENADRLNYDVMKNSVHLTAYAFDKVRVMIERLIESGKSSQ